MQLYDYQNELKGNVIDAWSRGVPNILGVAPTGSGKTVVMSSIFRDHAGRSCAIAHRQELVSQISCAMAAEEIEHNVIASDSVVKFCIQRHVEEFGRSYHHTSSPVAVAGVQTLIKRDVAQWANQVSMWTLDEAHHALPDNSWGKATAMFPRARGLGLTASPLRCDRKPLGRAHGGLFDEMIVGPSMRQLINKGRLAEYRIFAPTLSINRTAIKVSESTGDFNQHSLREETKKSSITGDIVASYLKFANGKRGITFVPDVDTATEVAQKYIDAGVPSMAVSAKTPDNIRQYAINKFKRGELLQLVNVDLFGEGFDVPAVEVVSMGRPTESFGLYLQQFGRALRMFAGKQFGILIDHVANVERHGLPDAKRDWSLDIRVVSKSKTTDDGVLPVTTCLECFSCYEATTKTCPFCGAVKEPTSRSAPEFVDGDITEYSPELLARLRGEIDAVEYGTASVPHGASPIVARRLQNLWAERQSALHDLRAAIDLWAGIETTVNDRSVSDAYRTFYHTFGIDTQTAQTLPRDKMIELMSRIQMRTI